MFFSRSHSRADHLPKFANAYLQPKPGHCSYYNLSRRPRDMGRKKKQKTINHVWRPVCTQTHPIRERLTTNMTVEVENDSKILKAHCICEDFSSAQDLVEGVFHVTPSSSTLQGDGKGIDFKGKSAIQVTSVQDCFCSTAQKHSVSLEVGASVIRFIRGKEGATQKETEEEMGVKIVFPSSKKEDSIVIEGASADGVTRASEKIQTIIDKAVRGPNLDYSHFVSLPLAIHPQLVDRLFSFQNSILRTSDTFPNENSESDSNEDFPVDQNMEPAVGKRSNVAVELKVEENNVKVDLKSIAAPMSPTLSDLGIEKSIFIKPKTFHLTVLMLKLWNKDRVNAASKLLKSISSKVMNALENRPVFVRLKGLDCMRGSLAKARVLYAPVEEIGNEDRLLRACQVIIDEFVEAGLVLEKDAKQKLKLHATVMNARHRKRTKRTRKLDFFDARGIFEQFGSEEWGEYLIREAHLSQRFAFDESGYYHCCASIPFPESMQVD